LWYTTVLALMAVLREWRKIVESAQLTCAREMSFALIVSGVRDSGMVGSSTQLPCGLEN